MWTKEIKAGWMRWVQVEEGPQNRANKKVGVNIAELSLLVLHFGDQEKTTGSERFGTSIT